MAFKTTGNEPAEKRLGKKLRIMIVDDNQHARNALSAFISTCDWVESVDQAPSGENAIEKIEDQIPDLILMDAQMPAMSGLQATQIIKKRWPNIKVIILTIYADYKDQSYQVGADAFLIKGCSIEEIISTIHMLN